MSWTELKFCYLPKYPKGASRLYPIETHCLISWRTRTRYVLLTAECVTGLKLCMPNIRSRPSSWLSRTESFSHSDKFLVQMLNMSLTGVLYAVPCQKDSVLFVTRLWTTVCINQGLSRSAHRMFLAQCLEQMSVKRHKLEFKICQVM